MARWLVLLVGCCLMAAAAPKRVLYVTHSAGYRHDSIPISAAVLEQLGAESGAFEILWTEDLSWITAERLRDFDALFFFTSGELALSDSQKAALLDFVRSGKGFGGAHSATDTLYGWPAYGDLIGAYFDGHPWVQRAGMDVEDPDHPATKPLAPNWDIVEEFYQFREFSRDRVRVLLTLDTASVDLKAPGVNRKDGDFALAWCRPYGGGRVFYTALGHFEETWRDPRFQRMLEGAMRWLTRQADADCSPRGGDGALPPEIADGGIVNGANYARDGASPGGVISIFGRGFTTGSAMTGGSGIRPVRLAGAQVLWNGAPVPLLYASPTQINAQMPYTLKPGETGRIAVSVVGKTSPELAIEARNNTPAVLAVSARSGVLSIYCVGLGAVDPPVAAGVPPPVAPLSHTVATPSVTLNGVPARVYFSGLAPFWPGLYQIDVEAPPGSPQTLEIAVQLPPQ